MEREVGMKAFYNLTTNKKVFELFLSDPRGVELAESVARNRWNGPISSLIKKLRGIKPVYIGGERDVQDVYWETVMLLTRMFFHDHMSPKAFHILTSDNPLDYFKITPLTFLNEKPRIISQNGNAAKASNTRKVLAGRDTMPVSLAMVDVYSEKHATAHTISGNFGFSPKALISGGITNFSRMSAVGAGRIGTLVGGYRAGYNRSRSWFKEMGQKKDALLSSQFTLLIDQLLLEFEADTTSCLHIEARDPDGEGYDSLFYMFGTDKDSYLVCYPQKNDKRLFREMWYFINTANTDSTHFVDHNNLANRPIVMPLRGLRNFVQFRNSLVHQVENFIVMRKDQYEPLARHALKDLYNIRIDDIPEFLSDGEFPGAIPWNYGSELRQLNLDGSTKLGVFGKDL